MSKRRVARKGETAVVETESESGELQRVIVPVADEDSPERGIPQGIDWTQHITVDLSPDDFANQLRRAGIWEYGDLLSNPAGVQGAVMAAVRPIIQQLMSAAKAAR